MTTRYRWFLTRKSNKIPQKRNKMKIKGEQMTLEGGEELLGDIGEKLPLDLFEIRNISY